MSINTSAACPNRKTVQGGCGEVNLVDSGSGHPRVMIRHIALTSEQAMQCNISTVSRRTASHQWIQYRIANAVDFTGQ